MQTFARDRWWRELLLFALYSFLYCFGVFLLWDASSFSHNDCVAGFFPVDCTANIW